MLGFVMCWVQVPRPIARCLYGQQDALGPAAGEVAGRLRSALLQVERHADDAAFEFEAARERRWVEPILDEEGRKRILEQLHRDRARRRRCRRIRVLLPTGHRAP